MANVRWVRREQTSSLYTHCQQSFSLQTRPSGPGKLESPGGIVKNKGSNRYGAPKPPGSKTDNSNAGQVGFEAYNNSAGKLASDAEGDS